MINSIPSSLTGVLTMATQQKTQGRCRECNRLGVAVTTTSGLCASCSHGQRAPDLPDGKVQA